MIQFLINANTPYHTIEIARITLCMTVTAVSSRLLNDLSAYDNSSRQLFGKSHPRRVERLSIQIHNLQMGGVYKSKKSVLKLY